MSYIDKKYWENLYLLKGSKYTIYDGWLDKYLSDLKNASKIVDLGCGDGVNTIFLRSQNIYSIACDFSETALYQIKKRLPEAIIMCFDMIEGLPFDTNSIDVVIADLSIHYFDWNTTTKLIKEIFRILNENGLLLCRINSTKEYQKNESNEILEENFYFNGENHKRLFDEKSINTLFSDYHISYIIEETTNKYGNVKHLWEVAVKAD